MPRSEPQMRLPPKHYPTSLTKPNKNPHPSIYIKTYRILTLHRIKTLFTLNLIHPLLTLHSIFLFLTTTKREQGTGTPSPTPRPRQTELSLQPKQGSQTEAVWVGWPPPQPGSESRFAAAQQTATASHRSAPPTRLVREGLKALRPRIPLDAQGRLCRQPHPRRDRKSVV